MIRTLVSIALVVVFMTGGFASDRWDTAHAEADAERDFLAHRVQFYWHGTRGSYPVGVPVGQLDLARRYPHLDAGVGCDLSDQALRARQKQFAEIYNAKMLSFILRKQ